MKADWKRTDQELPPDDRTVMIWWLRAEEGDDFRPKPGPAFGRYIHALKEWRPSGCNGDFSDQITHWDYKPEGPA